VPEYWYSAVTASGAVEEGWLRAASEGALEESLRERGVFLVRSEVGRHHEDVHTLTDGVVDRRELLAFLEYVAGAFDVGIPILEVLDDVTNRVQSKRLVKIVGEVRYAISDEGKSLSEALGEHPLAFPALYVGTIRAGEATGQLGYALRQLVEYIDWQATITSQLKQATLYPIIVVVAVGLLVLGLIGFVFPRIIPVLVVQKVALPLPTRIILKASTIVRDDWLAVLIALNVVTFATYGIRRTAAGRLWTDGLLLRLPIVGGTIRDVNMARIVTYLSLFYSTGVELVLSLTLVERIIDNRAISEAVRQARELVVQGVSIATAFAQSPLFPTMVLRGIALGEATGHLDESLARAKEYYSREIPAAVRRMITLLQPVLIAFIGGVILTVALAIVLPILNIYNSIGVRH
jgi:type IV pilus assembly protein PilC